MAFENSEDAKLKLSITLPSDTPVIGCEIVPIVRIKSLGQRPVEDIEHSICFSWYRECVTCCVHTRELATVQCIACAKLKVPVKETYHCSPTCFSDSWANHVERHRLASEPTANNNEQAPALGSDGSLDDFGKAPATLIDEEVVEKEADDITWVKIGSSKTYEPTEDDFGLTLRLESVAIDKSTGAHLSGTKVIVTNPVINFPPRCNRNMIRLGTDIPKSGSNIMVEGSSYSDSSSSSYDFAFSVLSYNILSDLYTHNIGMYGHCPRWALIWQYRRKNLLAEIIAYDADIVCLQEVQDDQFENFFEPELAKCGYSAAYKKKTKEVYIGNKYSVDGCATFYRHDMFKEIMRYELEYAKAALPLLESLRPGLRSEGRSRLLKDNVALVVILESVKSGKSENGFLPRICVANTHINASPHFPDVKVFQITKLVQGLEKIAEAKVPQLICGDLNVLPNSDPYKFLSKGKIDPLKSKEHDPLGLFHLLRLNHSLYLKSAYASLARRGNLEKPQLRRRRNCEPHYTNFTPLFCGTLDYIFYTANYLRVDGLLELVDRDGLGVGLPTPTWSSDHMAIMASFKLRIPLSQNASLSPLPAKIW